MEEATELSNYMPLSFKSRSEQEYIAFLWNAFETNYTGTKGAASQLRTIPNTMGGAPTFFIKYEQVSKTKLLRVSRGQEPHRRYAAQQEGTRKKPLNSGWPEFNGNILILKNTASKIVQIFQPV